MQPKPPLCQGTSEQLDFVRAHTRLTPVAFLPDLRLHQADDPYGLWERTEDTGLPFWAFAWTGGLALARHLLDSPSLVAGRTVLDLASGSGLVAIAAARAGAAQVTASEVDPYAAAAIEANAAANHVQITAICEDLLDRTGTGFDVVLAGDVFYDRALARRVLPFLETAAGEGSLVLVGDPGRRYLPRGSFTATARYDVPITEALEDAPIKRTTVWQVPGPASA